MQSEQLSLFQLNNQIKEALKASFSSSYWVVGEIAELKENFSSGHCYLELVEKDENTGFVTAKNRATVWSATYRMIKAYFQTTTGTRLAAGIKILVRVTVEFHELYGLSLNIIDIEPTYTVGELARKKQEIINRLTAEGAINMNRELSLPDLPQRIAVISSKTAAGYGDFSDQLLNNPFKYKFYIKLFPAYMQGENAEQSIIGALEQIHKYEQYFDAVVIIRGGGSQVDLDCFNSYWLSMHIAQFPLPVLTGIGHEQDETVADIVAHTSLKTPTAVAEYLIDMLHGGEEYYQSLLNEIMAFAKNSIRNEKEKLLRTGILFNSKTLKMIRSNNELVNEIRYKLMNSTHKLQEFKHRKILGYSGKIRQLFKRKIQYELQQHAFRYLSLKKSMNTYFTAKHHQLALIGKKNQYLDPVNVLSRGYTITRMEGRVLKSANPVTKGTEIETLFIDGAVKSKVTG